jgi:arylformamidase
MKSNSGGDMANRSAAEKKAALTPKHKAAGKKAAQTSKLKQAGVKASATRKRKAATRKVAVTKSAARKSQGGATRIVDLSHVLDPGKAGRKFTLEMIGAETVNPNVVRLENQWYIMHNVNMVSHIGTHIEAPYHILKDRADLAGLPLEMLIGDAVVLDLRECPRQTLIEVAQLRKAAQKAGGIHSGDIVFCNLGGARFYGSDDYRFTPSFTNEAIAWLVDQGMKMMGVDATGVEVPGSEQHVNHHALFERGIPLIENLANLDSLSQSRMKVFALPIAVRGLEAFPLRVIAVEEN